MVASYDAATSGNVNVSGNTLTINPSADLANGTSYTNTVTLSATGLGSVAEPVTQVVAQFRLVDGPGVLQAGSGHGSMRVRCE